MVVGITLEGSISNTVFVNIGSQAGRTSFSCESLLLNCLQVCSCLVPCLSTFSSLPSPCFLLPHEAYGWSPLLVLSCTCNLFLKEAGRCSFPTLGLEADLWGGRKESSANTSVFLFFFSSLCSGMAKAEVGGATFWSKGVTCAPDFHGPCET